MIALEGLTAEEALDSFGLDKPVREERGEERGVPYRCRIWASQLDESQVLLCVAVDPLPDRQRRGLLGLVDAHRYGRHARDSMQTRCLPR